MSSLVVLQPSYLPWLGYFEQMYRCDYFIFYDDVQYDKNGWRNRNRIKSSIGSQWLTVPVKTAGRHHQAIKDVEIDNSFYWARKHIASIEHNYANAPYLKKYLPELEEILFKEWFLLVDLNIAVTQLMCRWLKIDRQIIRSSELGISGDRSERLMRFCRHFDVDHYISGDSAKNYLDINLFLSAGIIVEWQRYKHMQYTQLHGDFTPYMSTLDLVLNVGPAAKNFLISIR